MTNEQLVAAKAALEAGTSVGKFLEDENIDVNIGKARRELIAEYGRETMRPLFQATREEQQLYQFKSRFKRILERPTMVGKKTKFKNDLKAMINKL